MNPHSIQGFRRRISAVISDVAEGAVNVTTEGIEQVSAMNLLEIGSSHAIVAR